MSHVKLISLRVQDLNNTVGRYAYSTLLLFFRIKICKLLAIFFPKRQLILSILRPPFFVYLCRIISNIRHLRHPYKSHVIPHIAYWLDDVNFASTKNSIPRVYVYLWSADLCQKYNKELRFLGLTKKDIKGY